MGPERKILVRKVDDPAEFDVTVFFHLPEYDRMDAYPVSIRGGFHIGWQ